MTNFDVMKQFTNHSLKVIDEMKNGGLITQFEDYAFSTFCILAMDSANTYLNSDTSPLIELQVSKDFDALMKAYVVLCLIEYDSFLKRVRNKIELSNLVDTDLNKFHKDFQLVFGGDDISEFFNITLKTFAEIEKRDVRDLFFNQPLLVAKLIDPSYKFNDLNAINSFKLLALATTNVVEHAKEFDKILE